jgi:hypothetical protein
LFQIWATAFKSANKTLRHLTDKAVRRGSFVLPDLKRAIKEFLEPWNPGTLEPWNPGTKILSPSSWTATLEGIVQKVTQARTKLAQIKHGSALPRGTKAAPDYVYSSSRDPTLVAAVTPIAGCLLAAHHL